MGHAQPGNLLRLRRATGGDAEDEGGSRQASSKIIGPENPETLAAMHNLAVSHGKVRRPDKAIKMQEEVLSLSRKIKGPGHLETLGDMTSLAETYGKIGRRTEAIAL